jgi:hypothetical protein
MKDIKRIYADHTIVVIEEYNGRKTPLDRKEALFRAGAVMGLDKDGENLGVALVDAVVEAKKNTGNPYTIKALQKFDELRLALRLAHADAAPE